MNRIQQARTAGSIGIAVGALWLCTWAMQVFADPAQRSAAWYAGQAAATVALLGTAVLMYGYARVRAAGDGRVARTVLTLNWVAWVSLTLGGIGIQLTGNADGGPLWLFFPMGGIVGTLTGIIGGVLIVVRRRMTGWQRWTPLTFGLAYLASGFVQGAEPTPASSAAELVQYLLIVALAVGLRTTSFTDAPQRPAAVPAS